MDIHRSRFIPYAPSTINALSFSHASNRGGRSDPTSLRLAVGRSNGNIEIWNPAQGLWIHETTLAGGKGRSVEGLAWIQEPRESSDGQKQADNGKLRLFSIGYSSFVTEWDLVTGLPVRHSGGNHSEVWCMAAQPEARSTTTLEESASHEEGEYQGQDIVVGCADGTLAILSTADDDLRFKKYLYRPTGKKARVLSLTYQNRHIVVAGCADSAIRIFDTRNSTLLRTITLGGGPPGAPREVLVWTVKCLPHGTIVSGDSTGEIRFYDGKNFSQIQRISGHEADVLDLVVSKDGRLIFSGGMDRRTVIYRNSDAGGSKKRWAKLSHRRYHEHDLKAMATYEGRHLNVLVSGGLDKHPILLPLKDHGKENHRVLPALPQMPPLDSAPKSRLVVSWWECEARVWHTPSREEDGQSKMVARIVLKGDENITSASITDNGNILSISTTAETKLFQLEDRRAQDGEFQVRKVDAPTLPGGRITQLSPDGKWLNIITHQNQVYVARIAHREDKPQAFKVIDRLVLLTRLARNFDTRDGLNGDWGNYNQTITRTQFSSDASMLIVGDLAGYLDSWVLEGSEDSAAPEIDVQHATSSSSSARDEKAENDTEDEDEADEGIIAIKGQHWIRNPSASLLPRLDSSPIVLAFRPSSGKEKSPHSNDKYAVQPARGNSHPTTHDGPHGEQRLMIVTARHQVFDFNLREGRLSEWSRRNPSSIFPREFREIRDRTMGILWDIGEDKQRLWLYGSSWMFMVDLNQDMPIPAQTEDVINNTSEGSHRKRKRGQGRMELKKNTSGAGSRLPEKDLPGIGRKVRKITGSDSEKSTMLVIDSDGRQQLGSDEESEAESDALPVLRRDITADAPDTDEASSKKGKPWWLTHKYRPILGIVPIGEKTSGGKVGQQQEQQDEDYPADLEVVLVERPSWDFDLPPRFVGPHER